MLSAVFGWVRKHPIWSGLAVVAVALGAWQALKPEPPKYEYITGQVTQGDVVRRVSASGKLRALNTVKVGAEVSGQLVRVNVDFNSAVRRGQELALIDQTPFQARVQQARAQIQVAQAQMAQAEAALFRGRAQVELQERELSRRQALLKDGFVSKQAMDTVRNQLDLGRAEVKSAQAQIQSARAQITQSQAELDRAQLDLSRSRIEAPIDGVVINRLVDQGQTVASTFQTPTLFEIAADLTRMQVEASVDEADIGQIEVGQPVSFTVDAFPDETFRGSVKQIRKAATETQNVVTYMVVLDVDNQSGKLLPGMTATVDIITGVEKNVLRAPTSALRFRPRAEQDAEKEKPDAVRAQGPTAPQVWIKGDDDRAKPTAKPVKIGLQSEEFTQLLGADLKVGDAVIVRAKRRDGQQDED
jgi:HlyD family secretion protein